MSQILVVEDDRLTRVRLTDRLTEAGYQVQAADGVRLARKLIADAGFDAVLLDIGLKDGDGLQLLEEIRQVAPNLPVIMVTGYGDSERTIRAMRAGAFEYVTKPFDLEALLGMLARAVRVRAPASIQDGGPSTPLVGSSPAMLAVWKTIGRAAASRMPVLITGESGTGKELVARAIHDHDRAERPFVAVNIAALPPSLVESELFGHERGAFTGAVARREGRFEHAKDGTLFLDEIADLEPSMQSKLLRVLEDGGYERVGDSTRLASQARIISATSKEITPGPDSPLREDLYYRLAVLRIDVPPLRERRSDIPLLAQAFLRPAKGPPRAVTVPAMERLMAHDWPGNVRQLRHVLENACVMSSAEVLDEADFDLGTVPTTTAASVPSEERNLNLHENIELLERELIEAALARAEGNRAQAARVLGIRRALLYARMLQFGLHSSE